MPLYLYLNHIFQNLSGLGWRILSYNSFLPAFFFLNVSTTLYCVCLGLFCSHFFASSKYFFQELCVEPWTKPASRCSFHPAVLQHCLRRLSVVMALNAMQRLVRCTLLKQAWLQLHDGVVHSRKKANF